MEINKRKSLCSSAATCVDRLFIKIIITLKEPPTEWFPVPFYLSLSTYYYVDIVPAPVRFRGISHHPPTHPGGWVSRSTRVFTPPVQPDPGGPIRVGPG